MRRYTVYFWKTALHVSGGITTHHQEHTELYLQNLVLVKPLLLPAAIVDELERLRSSRTKRDQYNSLIALKPVPTHPQ